jgi:YfiH family protein
LPVPVPDPAPIRPDWPAPPQVHALSTTRQGGVSTGAFAGLNLGEHCGDQADAVARNRARLRAWLPAEPGWVRQVHGIRVLELPAAAGAEADAVWTATPGVVCAVLTADCLPVLFCDRAGTRVAAAHAGWRGLAAGVLEATVAALAVPADQLHVWLGPAIGQAAFEVGPEVRAAFIARDPRAIEAFRPGRADRWHADLDRLARQRLGAIGIRSIHGGGRCTWSDAAAFYSFRRDGRTGRMANLVWIAPPV